MKKSYIFAALLFAASSLTAQIKTVDFEELNFPEDQKFWNGDDESGGFTSKNLFFNNSYNSEWDSWTGFAYSRDNNTHAPGFGNMYSAYTPLDFWNGSDGSEGFTLGNVHFSNNYNTTWSSWSGFSFSNETDNTTSGWGNQFSAITGEGVNGNENYIIYNSNGVITLDESVEISEIQVANSTYAYFSMLDGDDFAQQFEQDDWFSLTIYGWDETDNVTDSLEYYLADFRSSDVNEHYILDTWESVDLSSLGSVKQLSFKLQSSDVGEWGMNTPNYFALGGLTFNQEDAEIALDFDELNFPSSGNNGSQNYAIYNNGTITFDSLSTVSSLAVANTTYAALSMKEGDAFTQKFEEGDWFSLTIYGWDKAENITDSVVFYFADFRSTNNEEHYILDHWEEIDITSLGEVKQLTFKLNSSDIGEWGMNTPNFFALDDILYEVTQSEDNTGNVAKLILETTVYPNPTQGLVTVEAVSGTLRVLSFNGQQLETLNHTEKTTVDLSRFAPGIYWIELSNENGRGIAKVIVN